VARALDAVVARFKAEGRYVADEIDVAAAEIGHELGISGKMH